jgi:transposase
MADIEKKTKRDPSDLTDEEWVRIAPLLPKPAKKGRKPAVDLREVLNAIRYMARSGGGWRMLPRDFPPWQKVYWWFRRTSPTVRAPRSSCMRSASAGLGSNICSRLAFDAPDNLDDEVLEHSFVQQLGPVIGAAPG